MLLNSMIHLGHPTLTDSAGNPVGNPDVLFTNLLTLVQNVAQDIIDKHYNHVSLTQLSSGVDVLGKPLPSTAAAAADRLGWRPSWKVSNSRVLKMGQSSAVAVLKGCAWRLKLFNQLLAVMPPREELFYNHKALQSATTGLAVKVNRGGDEPTVRNMTRSLMKYFDKNGSWPKTFFDVFPTAPTGPNLVNIAAGDKQYATRSVDQDDSQGQMTYVLNIKLPTITYSKGQEVITYGQYVICFNIPQCYHERVKQVLASADTTGASVSGGGVKITLPLLRVSKTGVLTWCATLCETPNVSTYNPDNSIGLDLNKKRVLTATCVSYDNQNDAYEHTAAVHTWDGLGVVAKLLRLQDEQDEISRKLFRLKKLAENNPDKAEKQKLENKVNVLEVQKVNVNDKRKRLKVELAHDAATWVRTLCGTYSAANVFHENLAGLPAGLDSETNRVLSQLPRSSIYAYVKHRCGRDGVLVKSVDPRNTSKFCPYCLNVLDHTDYTIGVCKTCSFNAHRDDLSPVRVGQKGHATHKRKKIKPGTRKVVDHKVKKLPKTGPTPKQVKKVYRKNRKGIKTQSYKKPVPFSVPRVHGDIRVQETNQTGAFLERMQYLVGTPPP